MASGSKGGHASVGHRDPHLPIWPSKDVVESLLRLLQPLDYYSLLFYAVGANNSARGNLELMKWQHYSRVDGQGPSGAQVVFSSILPGERISWGWVAWSCRSTTSFVAVVVNRDLAFMIMGATLTIKDCLKGVGLTWSKGSKAFLPTGWSPWWQRFYTRIDGGGKLHPTVKWESGGPRWKAQDWRQCGKERLRRNKTWIKGAEAVHSYTIPQTSLQLKHYTLLSFPSYPHLGISIPFIRCSSKNFCQTWGPTILHIQIPAFSFFTLTLLSPDFTLFTVFILVDEYLYFLFLHFQVTAVTRPCTGYLSSCPQNLQIR